MNAETRETIHPANYLVGVYSTLGAGESVHIYQTSTWRGLIAYVVYIYKIKRHELQALQINFKRYELLAL